MPSHRFTIGQMVRLVTTKGLSPAAAVTYTVEAPMPAYQNSPQYRLWNAELQQGRVALERELEAVQPR
jgi:chitodextrinase